MANDDKQQAQGDATYDPRLYEDELDTDSDATDPVTAEETDDPTRVLGVPPDELDEELDKLDTDGDSYDDEDMREYIEDQDEEMGERQ